MATLTRDAVFQRVARMDIHTIASQLVSSVGATVVQAMTGTKDRGAPHAWARQDGPVPRPDTEARLRLGYRVWMTLESSEGPDIALTWIVGSNPNLGEATPVTYIRANRSDEVLGAAEAFVNDTYS